MTPSRTLLEIATGAKSRRRPRQLESAEQKAFVARWRMHPDTRDLPACAIPNGGGRSKATAGILKAEGVSAGAPDWLCFEPMVKAHAVGVTHHPGLALEFKSPGGRGRVSEAQAAWHAQLRARRWVVVVVRSQEEAWAAVRDYLELRR